MEEHVFTPPWTAASTLKLWSDLCHSLSPTISSVWAIEFHSKVLLHLKSLGLLQSTPITLLYSYYNLSEEKQRTRQERQLSQRYDHAFTTCGTAYPRTIDWLIYRLKGKYISCFLKNDSSQVKHTFWQLWSLWYVSVHWNAGTESQTGLHHVLLEEWERCAKYKRKKK